MSGLFDAQEPKVTLVDRAKTIVPPALVGLLFVLIGYTKFDSNPRGEWYQIFEQIGLGQWFRHVPFFIVPFFLAIVVVIVAMICRESNS